MPATVTLSLSYFDNISSKQCAMTTFVVPPGVSPYTVVNKMMRASVTLPEQPRHYMRRGRRDFLRKLDLRRQRYFANSQYLQALAERRKYKCVPRLSLCLLALTLA